MSSEVIQSFTIDERTKWTCGVCGDGRLSIIDNSLHQQRDAGSYANDDHPNWEPDWETGRFSCLFTCDECHDTVTVGGTYGYDERIVSDARGEPDDQLVPVYAPSSVEPGPRLLMRPKGLPSEIEGALALCERLFWVDASAACNVQASTRRRRSERRSSFTRESRSTRARGEARRRTPRNKVDWKRGKPSRGGADASRRAREPRDS